MVYSLLLTKQYQTRTVISIDEVALKFWVFDLLWGAHPLNTFAFACIVAWQLLLSLATQLIGGTFVRSFHFDGVV
jgi:hypothetical protein